MRIRLLPVLLLVAGFALTARLGEVWTGFDGLAQAQTNEQGASQAAGQAPAADQSAPPTPQVARGEDPSAVPATDPLLMTDEELDILQALGERRRELERREKEVSEREALLIAAERRLEEKLASLKDLQKAIEQSLQQRDGEGEAQILSLVKIYESMKAKDAARIFDQLEMDVLMPVVERMKERKTAPILAKMVPEKAREVTAELARRREAEGAETATTVAP